MKNPTACRQCRKDKRKCVRRRPNEPCTICQKRHLSCDGHIRRRQSLTTQPPILAPKPPVSVSRPVPQAAAHVGQERDPLELPHGMAVELVEHYLEKVHDRPHSLFHPATLRSQVRGGFIDKAVLYAVCALGSKFSANPDTRAWEERLAVESKRLLKADLENVCLENVQGCILIATLGAGNCNGTSEVMFFRMAAAMSDIMGLNTAAPDDSPIIREIKRRIWWSLSIADGWCMSSLGLPSQMRGASVTIDLPMDEGTFHSMTPSQTTRDVPWKPGLWAHLVLLVRIFDPLQDLNRRSAEGLTPKATLDAEVERLSKQLCEWEEKLSESTKMNPQNIYQYQAKGLGGLFFAIHLTYHHFSTLLYFRFLEDQHALAGTDRAHVTRCKSHASSFSALLRQSRQLKGCEALYPFVGHMTTVSSSVHLHTLLFGEVDEIQTAREELNANFESLIELRQYWPNTVAMVNRLITFQNICLLSTESNTHRLDGFMVRFLIEHSLSLNDRDKNIYSAEIKLDSETVSSKARLFTEQGRYMDFQSQH